MVSGPGLTNPMRSKLYQIARDMLLEGKSHKSFKTKLMEGLVTTENKFGGMGAIFGNICEADVDTDEFDKKTTVKFIISKPYATNEQIEDGRWMSMEEYLEEQENFYKSHPAAKAHLN